MPKRAPWMPGKQPERFEIGRIVGEGKTKTEAKENAIAEAAKVLSFAFDYPHQISLRGMTALIIYNRKGFQWSVLKTVQAQIYDTYMQFWHDGEPTLEETIGKVLLYLAEQTWSWKGTDECPFDAKRFPAMAEEYAKNCKYQRRFSALRESGLFNDVEMQHIAGEFYHMFKFSAEQQAVIDSL